jgi:hypothetical protein
MPSRAAKRWFPSKSRLKEHHQSVQRLSETAKWQRQPHRGGRRISPPTAEKVCNRAAIPLTITSLPKIGLFSVAISPGSPLTVERSLIAILPATCCFTKSKGESQLTSPPHHYDHTVQQKQDVNARL